MKKCDKSFTGGLAVLREGRRLASKISIIFFVSIEVLNIFHFTIFSKNTLFSRITVKNNFLGGMTIFDGMGRRTTKMNITFCMENAMPNTAHLAFYNHLVTALLIPPHPHPGAYEFKLFWVNLVIIFYFCVAGKLDLSAKKSDVVEGDITILDVFVKQRYETSSWYKKPVFAYVLHSDPGELWI